MTIKAPNAPALGATAGLTVRRSSTKGPTPAAPDFTADRLAAVEGMQDAVASLSPIASLLDDQARQFEDLIVTALELTPSDKASEPLLHALNQIRSLVHSTQRVTARAMQGQTATSAETVQAAMIEKLRHDAAAVQSDAPNGFTPARAGAFLDANSEHMALSDLLVLQCTDSQDVIARGMALRLQVLASAMYGTVFSNAAFAREYTQAAFGNHFKLEGEDAA